MRGIDLFCASQSSTAIRLGMDQPSPSSSSSSSSSAAAATASLASSRAIDRHNPIIRDARRVAKSLPLPPCSAHPSPVAPAHLRRNGRKSSSKPADQGKKDEKKKKKSAKAGWGEVGRQSSAKDGDFIRAPDSSRYLLDPAFFDVLTDFDSVLSLVPADPPKSVPVNPEESSASNQKPPTSSRSPNQVVVLRVSLHCRGCEGKVRKHISRMQGVQSFNIDFAAKKVTVVGEVTPLEVLASISKVKNAQLWTAHP